MPSFPFSWMQELLPLGENRCRFMWLQLFSFLQNQLYNDLTLCVLYILYFLLSFSFICAYLLIGTVGQVVCSCLQNWPDSLLFNIFWVCSQQCTVKIYFLEFSVLSEFNVFRVINWARVGHLQFSRSCHWKGVEFSKLQSIFCQILRSIFHLEISIDGLNYRLLLSDEISSNISLMPVYLIRI